MNDVNEGLPRTKKAFTVVFQCCDPPIPIFVLNTDSETVARKKYRQLAEFFRENPGGETTLTLYKHTDASKRTEMFSDDPEYGGMIQYCLLYEGSDELESLTYMDLMNEERIDEC